MKGMSVSELIEKSDISEERTQKYLTSFEEYFSWEQAGNEKRYDLSSIEILQRITILDDSNHDMTEINEILDDEYAFTINNSERDATIDPTVSDIPKESDATFTSSFKGTLFSTLVFVGGGIVFFWLLLFLIFTSRI